MSESKPKKRTLADELRAYAERSVDGLQRGAGEIGALAQMLQAQIPPAVDDAAAYVAESLPGAGALESMRLGSQAGRDWGEGRYADALGGFADAVDAPFKDLWWLLPGAGLIPKVAK